VVFALNSSGLPAAPSGGLVYEGVHVTGVKELTITDPEPQRIQHVGDDRVFATDILPPTDAISGSLSVGKVNDALDAVLTGQSSYTIGEAKGFAIGTNKRGYEAQVGMLLFRQSQDTTPGSTTYGKRYWESRIIPKARVVPLEGAMNASPETRAYSIYPNIVTAHLWGTALASGTEGCTEMQMERLVTEYPPRLVAFNAEAAQVEFLFDTDEAAVSTDKIHAVWVDGVIQTSGITKATTKITFTSAPGAGKLVVVLYETAS
jgi:hypothetical protein